MRKKIKISKPCSIPLSAVMWIVTAVFLIPFYSLFVYAFKTKAETMGRTPLSFPTSLYLGNFV